MAQISVTIDGRKYRLACTEGEEARLESLAGLIDDKIGEMRKSFGEIGDQRLVIMAALTIADSLAEARDDAAAQRKRSDAAEERAQALVSSLDELGSRLEFARRAARGRRGGLTRGRSPGEATGIPIGPKSRPSGTARRGQNSTTESKRELAFRRERRVHSRCCGDRNRPTSPRRRSRDAA